MISACILIIITIFLPPVGVFLISGCGADLLINILLTLLGYFPGHIHAFYLEYVYYHRKEGRGGNFQGVYSQRQDQPPVAVQQGAYNGPPPQGAGYPATGYVGQQEYGQTQRAV